MKLQDRAADAQRRATELRERVASDRRWTAELKSRHAAVSTRLAATEQALARTLICLARSRPDRTETLIELSQAANQFAVKVRQRAERGSDMTARSQRAP